MRRPANGLVKEGVKKENWPELVALTSIFSVELPGIEPDALPGPLRSELPVGFDSVQFSATRYLQFRFRVLTASRAVSSWPFWRSGRGSPTGQHLAENPLRRQHGLRDIM
jgi:hypothetical protein